MSIPEAPENGDDLVTVKVFESDREWLKDEQARIRKLTGKEPTQGQLIRELIREKQEGSTPLAPPARSGNEDWHEKLDVVLVEGSDGDRIGIQQNLSWAVVSIRGSPPKKAQEAQAAAESVEEKKLLHEFRSGSLQKRRRMLAAIFKLDEPLGPEAMPSTPARAPAKRAGGK